MKSVNSFGVHFLLRHQDKASGKWTIYVKITVNTIPTEMALKCQVQQVDWNNRKGQAKPKNDEMNELNHYLDSVRNKIVESYKKLELQDEPITAEKLKVLYLGIDPSNEGKIMTLGKAFNRHYIDTRSTLEWGTLKNYNTTLLYVKKYCKLILKQEDIFLKNLNFAFIQKMEGFIPSHPIKGKKPCSRNGLMKHMERLKKISAWSVKMNWIDKDPFAGYQLKFAKKDPVFLELDELNSIENYQFRDRHIQYVADLFIFSCYTGLDYGDLLDLSPDQIGSDIHGNTWIYTSRNKTDISVVVPMLSPARAIRQKYSKNLPGIKEETLFARISNQEVNRCLKLIALTLGITKRLTFKTARHTFATTVTLLNGVPIETISKMMGHTKLSTTMIYTHITHAKIGLDMQALEDKIGQNKKIKSTLKAS